MDMGAIVSAKISRRPPKHWLDVVEETPDIDFRRQRRLVDETVDGRRRKIVDRVPAIVDG